MSRSRDGTAVGELPIRVGTGSGAAPPSVSTVLLPNIPRTTDEKSKVKYMTDYERYEPELRKHHLGGPDASITIGLRDVPADFNRAIPFLSEPTAAEREYERCLQLHAKANSRTRFFSPHSAKVPKQSRGFAAAASGGAGGMNSNRGTPRPADEVQRIDGAAAAEVTAVNSTTNDVSVNSKEREKDAKASAAVKSTGAAAAEAAAAEQQSPAAKNLARAASQSAAGASIATAVAAGRSAIHTSPSQATAASAATATTTTRAAAATAEGRQSPSHSQKVAALNMEPRATTASALSGAAATKGNRPFPGPRPKPPPQRRALDVDRVLRESRGQPVLVGRHMTQSGAAGSGDASPSSSDVTECASILRVLVDTPEEFMASFQLNTSFFDLRWMSRPSSSVPRSLTTLQSADFANYERDKVNSPRSVLVILRNGVDVEDLRPSGSHGGGTTTTSAPPVVGSSTRSGAPLPMAATGSTVAAVTVGEPLTTLPEDPELRTIAKRFRIERDHARREKLLGALLNDYATLCQQVPLPELLAAYRSPLAPATEHTEAVGAISTSVAQRLERQQRMFATNKLRLQRQLALMQGVHEREEVAEARRAQAEEEAKAALAAKAQEAQEAKEAQEARREARRQRNEAAEALYQQQLQEKLAKAEARSESLVAAQERLRRERQAQRAALAAEREVRFRRNAEALEALRTETDQKRQEKAAKLEEIEREREIRVREGRQALEERQARASAARAEAKKRAEMAQRAAHEAALARQQAVNERVEELQRQRAEEQEMRRQEGEAKSARRQGAWASAYEQEEMFRQRTRQRAAEQEEVFAALQHNRAVEHTIKVEREREEAAMKRKAVLQKQRVEEFSKLRTIARLIEKRKAADDIVREREEILKRSLKARDEMNAERERHRQELDVAKRLTGSV